MKQLLFEVAFTPSDVKEGHSSVCVVIDVIRASTTITNLLHKGCSEIVLTNDEQQMIRETPEFQHDGTLICAEQVSGDAAVGADFSPSLKHVEKVDVNARRVVMRTTNGTVAVHALRDQGVRHIFIGCMNNAQAVMKEAVECAEKEGTGLMIVAAGRENTQIAALDDAYCAAKLLSYGKQVALALGMEPLLADSALIANQLLLRYTDVHEAFSGSASASVMRRIGCEQDIWSCAKENTTDTVGKVFFESGRIHVKKVKLPLQLG